MKDRCAQLLAQRADEAGLADPGLAAEEHHLALALLGLPPAVEQQAELVLAPDQRRQARRLARLETALRAAAAEHPPGPHGCGEALEAVDAEVGVLEQAAEQAPGGRVDDHAARLGQGLEAGGEVRGLADHRLLLRRTLADQVADHDQPGRDADPGLERRAGARRQGADGAHRLEARAHRPLGLALVRPGLAEVGQHAVAHELGDVALEADDRAGTGVLVGADDLAQVLRVEAARELRRADQVAEQHRQLPPLGFRPR